jgi:hypothetical protein
MDTFSLGFREDCLAVRLAAITVLSNAGGLQAVFRRLSITSPFESRLTRGIGDSEIGPWQSWGGVIGEACTVESAGVLHSKPGSPKF